MAATDARQRLPLPELVMSRALLMWPGLDRRKLTRTGGDPERVARLVERRTVLSREEIVHILVREPRSEPIGMGVVAPAASGEVVMPAFAALPGLSVQSPLSRPRPFQVRHGQLDHALPDRTLLRPAAAGNG